ncbi:hypothetical protein [Crenobacter luteus]|uniref:hypothetical protein n=1 Tax=Crenobacter luteus TaxID=1452487 RepID=UPI0012E924C8|nr:hypothetical protein [Crenobacter luteus]
MSQHKAKGPALPRRASTESSLHPWFRLQSKHLNSIRISHAAQPKNAGPCPICGQRRTLGKRLAVTLFGQRIEGEVCPACHDAASPRGRYRDNAAHRLAQHQLYHRPEVRHAA